MRGIVLPVQVGGLLGGPKGMLAPPPPPLKLLGGPGPPGPPSSYAYAFSLRNQFLTARDIESLHGHNHTRNTAP